MTLTLTQTKQTKGTVVFAATDPDAAITTLYIRKGSAIEGEAIEGLGAITLTLGAPAAARKAVRR